MARLQFYDYHNMVVILEKGEFNSDFHPMVDFIAASPIRYTLTVKPTIFVAHIQQFWSTARIETTNEGTHILATVDGIQRTVSESSLMRNLKLRDEDVIVSIPDTELFENLILMGYNISQNQKLTFQKGQFSHQWKYLIHTIMQCLSPKSTGFNEFNNNIATAPLCLATNRTYNFSKMIFDGMVKNINNKTSKFLMYPRIVPLFDTMHVHQGEGPDTPTEPHHTPFPEADTSSHPTTSSIPLPSIPTAPTPLLPNLIQLPSHNTHKEQGLLNQDRETIAKSSTLPHDLAPRVTSPTADEGSMQHNISELTALCTSLQRQYSELQAKFQAQEEAIVKLKERVKFLEDKEDVARVLTSMDAATVLAGGIDVPTHSGFIPTAGPPATVISTSSKVSPTACPIVTRRKGKEVIVESDTPMKKKLQEQIDAQKREYYMAVIKSNLGWRFKDFKGMTFEEIEAKFAKVWKQVEDYIPIGSKEETERLKWKGLNLNKEKVKKQKSSEEAPEIETSTEEFTEEKMKEMMQLVPVEDVYVQALQVKHPIIDWKVHTEDLLKQLDREDLNQLWALMKEYLSIRLATSEKEMELWVELKRMYEPDPEDQLWTLTQNFMHAPVEWKLYDLSGVHHLTTKYKEIFMLVEKHYPLRRGLALVMITYKLQVKNYSQMAEDLIRKIYNIANTPRQQGD
nr:ribonuclease H-like domain, reverse transcriptase, RNA-dependent DNA polymerase [Tanacetum cinerariifolium]GEX07253.1 ribonuclease H-like domain, reverse transcriptase, RNA-dependent DNA polymerase [Tanacetum cinerariifolium]